MTEVRGRRTDNGKGVSGFSCQKTIGIPISFSLKLSPYTVDLGPCARSGGVYPRLQGLIGQIKRSIQVQITCCKG